MSFWLQNQITWQIETILIKSTDKFADRVLLYGQLTKGKALPLHFLKFLLASRTNGSLLLPNPQSQPFGKSHRPFFQCFFGSSKRKTIFVNLFR